MVPLAAAAKGKSKLHTYEQSKLTESYAQYELLGVKVNISADHAMSCIYATINTAQSWDFPYTAGICAVQLEIGASWNWTFADKVKFSWHIYIRI